MPDSAGGVSQEVAADGTVTDSLSSGGVAAQDQSFVTTGYLTVTADDPIAAAAEAIRVVEGIGGRIDSRQEYAPARGDNGSATLTLRIPSPALTPTIDKLKKLGHTEEVSTSSTNVSGQVTDLEARITSTRASVDRLTELLATATNSDALVTIESSLSTRQESLERLEAQQRSLGDQVSMATITLNLISVADAPVTQPDTFVSGLETGWNSFVAFISAIVVAFGVALPWLVFLGVLAGLSILIARLISRLMRRRAKTTTPAA